MSKKEYLAYIEKAIIKDERVAAIEKMYGIKPLDTLVGKIISCADEIGFFDDERRALSYAEIFNPAKNIKFDFAELGLIPLVDAYDNTYIVYIVAEQKWAKYNTADKVMFKKKSTLEEVL